MAWILLVVALALVTGYLIITFGYRTSIIVLLVTLGLGLVVVIWYAEFFEGTRSDLIRADEVSLDNFRVEAAYGNSFTMFARVLNESAEREMRALGLQISAADCPVGAGPESCVIVGQTEQEIGVSVPSRQGRDITRQFVFPPMRPQGELSWSYRIQYVKAQ